MVRNGRVADATVFFQSWFELHQWVSVEMKFGSKGGFCLEVTDFAVHLTGFSGVLPGCDGWHPG